MCGNVDQMLPVCRSWEDHLWAHLNSLLHNILETVRSPRLSQKKKTLFVASQHHLRQHLRLETPHSLDVAVEAIGEEKIRNQVTYIFEQLRASDFLPIRYRGFIAHHYFEVLSCTRFQ